MRDLIWPIRALFGRRRPKVVPGPVYVRDTPAGRAIGLEPWIADVLEQIATSPELLALFDQYAEAMNGPRRYDPYAREELPLEELLSRLPTDMVLYEDQATRLAERPLHGSPWKRALLPTGGAS